jgi:hypothetical protein
MRGTFSGRFEYFELWKKHHPAFREGKESSGVM